MNPEEYIYNISAENSPLDILGMYILCRIYHCHFGLVYFDGSWCSSADRDFQKTDLMLIFQGGNVFSEICVQGRAEFYLDSLIRNTEQGNMPSHNKDTKVFGHQADLETELNDSDIEILSSVCVPADVKPKVKTESKANIRPIVKIERLKYSAATKILLKAKRELSDVKIKKELTNKITKVIQSGNLRPAVIAQNARKRNKRVEVTCEFCSEIIESTCKYIIHRKQYHPEEPFHCKVCSKSYKSFNGCYKHEQTHSEFKLFCPVCGKGFNYQNDYDRHFPVHDATLKVYCSDCGKGFACNSSLTRHAIVHQNLVFTCSDCPKQYNTKDKLNCHWRGIHGTGYVSRCGEFTFKWTGPRATHEKDCTPCKSKKAQGQPRPKLPRSE